VSSSRYSRISLFTLILLLAPAVATAANITSISFVTNGNAPPHGGVWGTNSAAAIGVSDPGSASNPFLDPGGIMSISSGTYLLFFGYEDRFAGANPGDITAVLTVDYSDSTSKTATFLNASLASAAPWTWLSGDSSLRLGSSGITNVDRVGSTGAGSYIPNGTPDVVLLFSDTSAPEPATYGLLAVALGLGTLLRRFRAR
jgi:hypothetical protein